MWVDTQYIYIHTVSTYIYVCIQKLIYICDAQAHIYAYSVYASTHIVCKFMFMYTVYTYVYNIYVVYIYMLKCVYIYIYKTLKN